MMTKSGQVGTTLGQKPVHAFFTPRNLGGFSAGVGLVSDAGYSPLSPHLMHGLKDNLAYALTSAWTFMGDGGNQDGGRSGGSVSILILSGNE